ncbi:MAG: DinB family protein [Syntrophaceae bacterium]|nr:DinB family protein [Syntrophaceae bacterium]
MSWRELISREMESNYKITQNLLDLVKDEDLNWKPATGSNWMTTAQLLMHLTIACGASIKGFVTGDWGMPEGMKIEDLSPEEMLPPAEKLPAIGSVAETKKLLAQDEKLAFEMLDKCSDSDLKNKPAPAPWDTKKMVLGHRLLDMVDHLRQHKGQLYYYLKLQGKPVHTGHLYGM